MMRRALTRAHQTLTDFDRLSQRECEHSELTSIGNICTVMRFIHGVRILDDL